MFVAMPIAVVIVAAAIARSTKFLLALVALLLLTGGLAYSGLLANFESLPPRLLLMILPVAVVTVFAAFGRIGDSFRDLPISWLVGVQAFRFPLELMIYKAVEEGVAPPQFTWTGMNYDVLAGITALLIAPFASSLPKWALWCWNVACVLLLLNIVVVATISTPGPLQVLKPDNTWIAYSPFVWLPTICVMAALFGHVVLTRRLIQDRFESYENSN